MAYLKLVANAVFYPSKDAPEHFEFQVEGWHIEPVSVELWNAFIANLQRKVPFIPAGQERIAHLEVEVLVCDV